MKEASTRDSPKKTTERSSAVDADAGSFAQPTHAGRGDKGLRDMESMEIVGRSLRRGMGPLTGSPIRRRAGTIPLIFRRRTASENMV